MADESEIGILIEYAGNDVKDGTIAIDTLTSGLDGFQTAYRTTAAHLSIDPPHEVRLAGLERGSVRILFSIWEEFNRNAQILRCLGQRHPKREAVVGTLITVIQIKKHLGGNESHHAKPASMDTPVGRVPGTINVVNSTNVTIQVPPEAYSLYEKKELDIPLARMMEPLSAGHVDTSTIAVTKNGKVVDEMREVVTAAQRGSFTADEGGGTEEMDLTGEIESMDKSANGRFLRLADGRLIHFQLPKEEPSRFYPLFAWEGPVAVKCAVALDARRNPLSAQVVEMRAYQRAKAVAAGR